MPPTRVLFVTGKLAEPALRRVLAEMQPPFAVEVAVLGITVAALLTTPWIARYLTVPPGTDLILLPGLTEGDPALLTEQFGVPAERGPKDLRDIPRHFGQAAAARDYGAWDIEILAEINNAPRRSREALLAEARHYQASGADLIDVGCTPGVPFPHLGEVVRELRGLGMRVSVDTFDRAEIQAAVAAGAECVLSVNGSNPGAIEDLRGTGARAVAIPDFGAGLETLEPTLAALERAGVPYLIDPIVEPIGFGFMASLERYAEIHRRYPGVPQLMGVGNITELTSADTTGMHALLLAVCQEVGVKAVLTTEVIPWARGAVREIDIARRLMHYAVTQKTTPKHVDDRLVTVKDPRILTYSEAELREVQARVRDANFRIFTDGEVITVFNHERFVRGTDIQEIFDQLGVTDASHGFYLGKELAKARLANQLGKTYRQEGALTFGYLTPADDPKREHFRPTARPRPAGGGPDA
ncbi:MAG: dihydropteroate synthase [Gemmatimonadetes bacterium]|nr:dihydropteroate synthase [Gemmatimonadota bacterium]MBK7717321.1 dihydropteroate synthase [Gemmatimonadota bacterium]MBK7925822.1 dihydropteroate synthase [Gemmatimonadota bacterium]MBK9691837.1 dihydropteroate synthase [Gemmatimonadota bacterium]